MRLANLALYIATVAVTGAGAAACGRDQIAVSPNASHADYNLGALRGAVDAFVKAGRTSAAYAELSRAVLALRPGMDRTVADEAELKLVVLALGPVQAVSAKPMPEQVEALALTVWPALLAPPIEADAILVKRDNERAAELSPKPGETAGDFLRRLCGGPLASDCKQIVPEYQGHVIAAIAARRATERARDAVGSCMTCSAEPGWRDAVRGWETIDRMTNGWIHEIERKASPDNWPTAGRASELPPALPEAQVTASGEIAIGGQRYGAGQRIDALRELRLLHSRAGAGAGSGGRGTANAAGGTASAGTGAASGPLEGAIALHLRPELTLAQVRAIVSDTRKSGAKRIAVIARMPRYPWEPRVYWLAEGAGVDTDLRPTDSLQLLLHSMDHLAGPGAVARVD